MRWGIHSFSIAKNVLFHNVQLSAEVIFKLKHSYLSPQFPWRESEFGEFCTSWSGFKWGSVKSSHGITLNYSIRWNLFIVAYDLLIWGKERLRRKEGRRRRKRLHLFLPSFPFCPLNKTLSLHRGLFYFSPCFSIMKNSREFFSLRSLLSMLKIFLFCFVGVFIILSRKDLLFLFKKLQL